jgi:hypothetical protein
MTVVHRIVTVAMTALMAAGAAACSGDAAADTPRDPGDQYIVGIDMSSSRPEDAINESRRLLHEIITSKVRNGDQLVLLEMYGGSNSRAHQWIDSVPSVRRGDKPSPADVRRLKDFQVRGEQAVSMFIDAASKSRIQQTDILGTLVRAGDYAKISGGRRSTLILLSDMENSTAELEMASDVPGPGWIATRKAQSRLPDLSGVCAVVSGAPATTSRGARIREFWEKYFQATGANLPSDNYREFVAGASQIRC